MIMKYIRTRWTIACVIALIIVGVTLVTAPWKHTSNAKADTSSPNDQYHNCNLNPHAPVTEDNYTFFPCALVSTVSRCVNIHYEPHLDSTVSACADAGAAAIGIFEVICQTTGDTVANTNIWDQLVPQHGEPAAYVSDYYIDTSGLNGWSKPIPQCNPYPGQFPSHNNCASSPLPPGCPQDNIATQK